MGIAILSKDRIDTERINEVFDVVELFSWSIIILLSRDCKEVDDENFGNIQGLEV